MNTTLPSLADFADPSAHGVPAARAIDFAAPEIWPEWPRACAGARRADARFAAEKRRRAEERALAASQGKSPTLPWGMNDPVTAAIYHLDGAETRRRHAATAARESALKRLRAGEVRGFGRPEKGRAPWEWVLPQEWENWPSQDRAEQGVSILAGTPYWHLHLHDPAGLPLIQALVAYSRCADATRKIKDAWRVNFPDIDRNHDGETLDLARTAIGRRLLGPPAGDADADDTTEAEHNALEELHRDLLDMLATGHLIAFRDGAELPAQAFALGAPFGDLRAWEGNDSVRVRPVEPPPRQTHGAGAEMAA